MSKGASFLCYELEISCLISGGLNVRIEDEKRQSVHAILTGRWNGTMVNVRVGWMGGKDLLEDQRL